MKEQIINICKKLENKEIVSEQGYKEIKEIFLQILQNATQLLKITTKKEIETIEVLDEDIQKILLFYKQMIYKDALLGKAAKEKIRERLREYSLDDLWTAIYAKYEDEWFREHNFKRGIAWFFESKKRIEKYIEEGMSILKNKPDKIKFGTDEKGQILIKVNPFYKNVSRNH